MRKKFTLIVLLIVSVMVFTSCSTGTEPFDITGKWQNIGSGTFGQVQSDAIVVFDGTNCNFYSPNDTYAFNEEDGTLTVTSYLFSETLDFPVTVEDSDHIQIDCGSNVLELERVQ